MVRFSNEKRKPIISTWVRRHPKPAATIAAGLTLTCFGYFGSHNRAPDAPPPLVAPDDTANHATSFGCDHLELARQRGGWLLTLVTKGPKPSGALRMEFWASYSGDTPDIKQRVVNGLSTLLPLGGDGGGLISAEGGVIDPAGHMHHCTRPVNPQ